MLCLIWPTLKLLLNSGDTSLSGMFRALLALLDFILLVEVVPDINYFLSSWPDLFGIFLCLIVFGEATLGIWNKRRRVERTMMRKPSDTVWGIGVDPPTGINKSDFSQRQRQRHPRQELNPIGHRIKWHITFTFFFFSSLDELLSL